MKRLLLATPLVVLFPGLLLSATGQDEDRAYRFNPAYGDGEKWVVSYQSQFSCRFQISSRGAQSPEKKIKKVANRKYIKTFRSVKEGRPRTIEHVYVVANRKLNRGGGARETTERLSEQGARVHFSWNGDTGRYDLSETSHDLPDATRKRLTARELYELFLPDGKVSVSDESWTPAVERPLSILFRMGSGNESPSVFPELETFACELTEVRKNDDQTVGVIEILVKTKVADQERERDVYARIHGTLLYDLTRQKPIDLTLSSRPQGITFRRSIEGGELHVNDMSVFIKVRYDTSGETRKDLEPEDLDGMELDEEPGASSGGSEKKKKKDDRKKE